MSNKFKMLYSLCFIFILTSCSTVSEPAFEIAYEPISDQNDLESFNSSYVTCYELALLEGQAAYKKVWRRQQVDLPVISATFINGPINSGHNSGPGEYYYTYAIPTEGNRRAAMQANRVLQDTWTESQKTCMMGNGFQEIRVYAANSSE